MDKQQRQTRLLEVIGTIDDAAMEAGRCPEVLTQIAELFDVRSGLQRCSGSWTRTVAALSSLSCTTMTKLPSQAIQAELAARRKN